MLPMTASLARHGCRTDECIGRQPATLRERPPSPSEKQQPGHQRADADEHRQPRPGQPARSQNEPLQQQYTESAAAQTQIADVLADLLTVVVVAAGAAIVVVPGRPVSSCSGVARRACQAALSSEEA